ncbi:MAG: deoxyguanosinetriphosphate triphosphohydrolase [Planctomycetota bacterium]|nr:MAG: deoxyguanosinetriphosphate triphosphohydrolase [Planctomycetota bacterium]
MADGDSLARYAVTRGNSRGRVHAEGDGVDACPFEADRQRILNCMAFRRLMHKTQVFVTDCGDHFRTRLTHTLEVVAQAQRLARRLGLNARLAGGIALAHDLGHAPFGHAGEKVLAELMKEHGGFEHNVQSLRVVDYLEHPYPAFRGLNLCFELRESLIKHRTWYDRPEGVERLDAQTRPLIACGPSAPLEGQVANLADAIAYSLHDIEDGLGEGALTEESLEESRLWRRAAEEIRAQHPKAILHAIRRPILDLVARRVMDDAVAESRRRIAEAGVETIDDVRECRDDLIAFSPEMQADMEELGRILYRRLYQNHRVIRMDSKARRLIRELFEAYVAEPRLLPERYAARAEEQGLHRVICDYIAGMTDRFCQEEHRQIFAPFHFG